MKRVVAASLLLVAAIIPPADGRSRACYRYVRSDAQRVIVTRESRGYPHAKNPRSSAFGCGQITVGNRRSLGHRLGIAPNTTDPAAQMRLMSAYIDTRYGSDHRALAFHNHHGWY